MGRSEILNKYPPQRESVLSILHDIQDSTDDRMLKEDDLEAVAQYTGISKVEVMGAATFYSMYSFEKRGKNVIRLCVSPACHMMDSGNVLDYLKKKLNAGLNEVTEDGLFTIEESACLGVCEAAPAMMINDKVYGNLNESKIDSIIDEYKKSGQSADTFKAPLKGNEKETRKVLKGMGEINPVSVEEYKAIGGFTGMKKAFEKKSSDIIDEVKKSGLKGRGGAGFPTGLKWSFTAPIEGNKYIICNADEGEPGTFKDRYLMENLPMKLIEGMIIAGYAIGASNGVIYIRGEYAQSIANVTEAIEQCRKAGLLGQNIADSGFDFDLEVRKGAGAYVCGEETSLIESMEGKRGDPRFKPPFPGVKGYKGLPSVVNNVETLCNIPIILSEGADAFKSVGTEKSPGTKLYTVMGDVEKPGIYELPMGITLKEIIDTFAGSIKGGEDFKAALVGGAAGCMLNSDALSMKLDYESPKEFGGTLGSGAVLIMSQKRDVFDILASVMKFFEHESCGKCSPCRIGTKRLNQMAAMINSGKGTEKEWEKMVNLSENMKLTAFCPLGQSPVMPIVTYGKYFADELNSKINKGE